MSLSNVRLALHGSLRRRISAATDWHAAIPFAVSIRFGLNVTLFAWGLLACTAFPVVADDRPNIVLLMGDDHGWDETGYNGHPHLKTPVLDQMAATGLRLDRFYAAHPTCSPTRGSVLTGRHPNRYGTFTPNYSIRPEEITIADLLGDAGYACGHFGKWHVGPVKADSPTSPGAMGFDTWLSHDNFFELDPVLSRDGGPPKKIEGESSQILIDAAKPFLASAKQSGKPSLTVIWFGSPHEPYSGLPEDLALYDDLPAEYAERSFRLTSNETGSPTTRPLRDVLQERYAEITAMDRAIGDLRDWLTQNDLRDNTLIWYCGDNGTPGDGIITSPLRGQKGNHYEGGVRVPGIIEWPARIKTPTSTDFNSVTSDILPTICDVLDVDVPDRPLDGISLMPILEGRSEPRSQPIGFWSFDTKNAHKDQPYLTQQQQTGTTPLVKLMKGIPTRNFVNYFHPDTTNADYGGTRVWLANQYKLIVTGLGDDQVLELYNLRDDPSESDNLAEPRRKIADEMFGELTQWQTSVLNSLTGGDYGSSSGRTRN
ncbi:sulfatase family protein [Crateriforma spongiae]|uniref:sulfatase family protein n=1 Tax=Crateriforma spongiae TaxID=2724528 RepID=UPI001447EC38|nr:sulfatase-like hydrolase/transferase [Crateriforma spongiae]